MPIKFVNNLETKITNVGGISAGAVSVDITPGDGAKITAQISDLGSNGVYTRATFKDASGNVEAVKITGISTDTLTIVRGTDPGETARAWAQDDILDFCLNKTGLEDITVNEQQANTTATVNLTAEDLKYGLRTFTNYGATAEVNYALPAGEAGLRARFVVVVDSQYVRCTANGTERVRYIDDRYTYVRSNEEGNSWDMEWVEGLDDWVITSRVYNLKGDE